MRKLGWKCQTSHRKKSRLAGSEKNAKQTKILECCSSVNECKKTNPLHHSMEMCNLLLIIYLRAVLWGWANFEKIKIKSGK